MSQPSEFNKAVTLVLDSMKSYFEKHSHDQVSIPNQQLFREVVKATIIKAYEFTVSINRHHEDFMFFTLPALRGICEEYIVEKFIWQYLQEDMNEIILLRHNYDHIKSCIIQWQYFEINRPDQRLYYQQDFPKQLKETEDQLKKLLKNKIPGVILKPVFPSVHYMCKQTGEAELYNYLYHASSTFVHFSPNNLLRMGWGKLPHVQFSTSNFKLYYKDFSLFYGLLLLSKLCEWQESIGLLLGFNKEYVVLMEAILKKAERWPELVTFEEMNIGAFSRNFLFKSPADTKKTD